MKLALILIALTFNSWAGTLRESLKVIDGKRIVLKGESCAVLEVQAQAILSWSNKLNENIGKAIPECYCNDNECILDVYDVSPEMAQIYQGENPQYSGPNCWNRALVFAKILPSLSYSTPEEISFWMGSALCQERLPNEEAQPGDIIVVRDFSIYKEVHGFTYLTDNLAFSKNGYSKYSAFEYQSLDGVFDVYRVPQNCRRVFGRPDANHECYYKSYANYFNCMSLDQYLAAQNVTISNENMAVYQRLLEIDNEVFSYLFNEYKELDRVQLLAFSAELEDGIDNGNAIIEAGNISGAEQLFWTAMINRAIALRTQIRLML